MTNSFALAPANEFKPPVSSRAAAASEMISTPCLMAAGTMMTRSICPASWGVRRGRGHAAIPGQKALVPRRGQDEEPGFQGDSASPQAFGTGRGQVDDFPRACVTRVPSASREEGCPEHDDTFLGLGRAGCRRGSRPASSDLDQQNGAAGWAASPSMIHRPPRPQSGRLQS